MLIWYTLLKKVTLSSRRHSVADFNQVLTPGDIDNGLVNTVVEIPEGSRLKVEWDRERAAFMLDRVDPAIFAKPCNYHLPGIIANRRVARSKNHRCHEI